MKIKENSLQISSFAEDSNGELYDVIQRWYDLSNHGLGTVKYIVIGFLLVFTLGAEVRLLPDAGANFRAITIPMEAEALFADHVVAPYGKSFGILDFWG